MEDEAGRSGRTSLGEGDSASAAFQEALERGDAAALARVPKADLHNHGILGMSFAHLQSLLGNGRVTRPASFKGLSDFVNWTSGAPRRYGRHPDWLPFLYDASCEAAAADGVKVLEMSFDRSSAYALPSIDAFLAMVERLFAKWAPSLRLKPELGFNKAEDPRRHAALIDAALGSGLFRSIDLYGKERLPIAWPSRWKPVYLKARQAGLKLKLHLGETEGPLGLLGAARCLEPDAIQHGLAFARSKKLLSWARDRGVAFNICPASNIALKAAPSLKAHPIRFFFDQGLRVTVNTDDLVAFDATASDQFLALYKEGVFSAAELDRIRLNGLEEGARG